MKRPMKNRYPHEVWKWCDPPKTQFSSQSSDTFNLSWLLVLQLHLSCLQDVAHIQTLSNLRFRLEQVSYKIWWFVGFIAEIENEIGVWNSWRKFYFNFYALDLNSVRKTGKIAIWDCYNLRRLFVTGISCRKNNLQGGRNENCGRKICKRGELRTTIRCLFSSEKENTTVHKISIADCNKRILVSDKSHPFSVKKHSFSV